MTGDDGDHVILIGDRKLTRGVVSVTVLVTIPRPNRYSFGILPDLPPTYNRGFAYKNGLIGWGLHDHTGSEGIFCQSQLVASSSSGYTTNDKVSLLTSYPLSSSILQVTITVDADRGNLTFKVNGTKCAEFLNIKLGVYIAATLFNKGAKWTIIDNP